LIGISAPATQHEGADLSHERGQLRAKSVEPAVKRLRSFDLPRVGCCYPTQAQAADAGMSLDGRDGILDDGHLNMPGGEFFFAPVEEATEGVIAFSEFPAVRAGHECEDVRLVFEGGRVVEASAGTDEEYLFSQLDADAGARVVGELGIGCNHGIQRYVKNTLFDEKIDGTVHVAVGAAYGIAGGRNESVVHWDMVKDLRDGGRIYLDGELVQDNGRWFE